MERMFICVESNKPFLSFRFFSTLTSGCGHQIQPCYNISHIQSHSYATVWCGTPTPETAWMLRLCCRCSSHTCRLRSCCSTRVPVHTWRDLFHIQVSLAHVCYLNSFSLSYQINNNNVKYMELKTALLLKTLNNPKVYKMHLLRTGITSETTVSAKT